MDDGTFCHLFIPLDGEIGGWLTNKLHLNLRRGTLKNNGLWKVVVPCGIRRVQHDMVMWPYSILNFVLWFLVQLQGRPRGTVCPYVGFLWCFSAISVFFNGLIPPKISSQESDGTKFHQSPLPALRCCAVLCFLTPLLDLPDIENGRCSAA